MSAGKYIEELLELHFNVLSSIPESSNISRLSDLDVEELVNWDAEKYRKSMLK